MPAVTVTHRGLDLGQIRQVLSSPQGPVAREMLRRGLKVETQAKRNLGGVDGPKRVDSGRLRASVHTALIYVNGYPAARVGTNVRYARYVHDGTGLYGPRHRLITPVRGKYLRFRSSRTGRMVYARSVKGMKPNAFLKNALRAARG